MNANELANKSFMELWDAYTSKKMQCDDLEEKLRQQQNKMNKERRLALVTKVDYRLQKSKAILT